MMRDFTFYNLVGFTCAVLLLAACSYSAEEAVDGAETIDLTTGGAAAAPVAMPPGEGPGADMTSDELFAVTNQATDDSVEIFPLSGIAPFLPYGPGPDPVMDSEIPMDVEGMPLADMPMYGQFRMREDSRNTSVQIYPLDDGMQKMLAPDLLPPELNPAAQPSEPSAPVALVPEAEKLPPPKVKPKKEDAPKEEEPKIEEEVLPEPETVPEPEPELVPEEAMPAPEPQPEPEAGAAQEDMMGPRFDEGSAGAGQ